MQTFLPYPDFRESARVLDNKRLGKQRVEAKQIYLALTEPTYGWKNHPAVKMWQDFEFQVARYGFWMCAEWRDRGFKDTLESWFYLRATNWGMPSWISDPAFHASHRSNLLRKDPKWYSQFGWSESPDLPYVWPV